MASLLNPTPPDQLCDAQGRPYFLWDLDMTLERFRELLDQGDDDQRAWLLGKLMRQAKPDDVFSFVPAARLRAELPAVSRYLGRTRRFWEWLLTEFWPPRDDG